MSTIEDFENAPIGATATSSGGVRAMKTDNGGWCWALSNGLYRNDEGMERRGSTLDLPAPTTAREALDLAWELAHEVKPGQVIPKGSQYLVTTGSGVKEYTAAFDIETGFHGEPERRTLEPLPEPKPDWLNAPAVIAVCNDTMDRDVFVRRGDNSWRSEFYGAGTTDLRDVVPLYPKETDR